MDILTSKVTSKGQIVIPRQIRARYGIKPATVIHWVQKADGLYIIPDSEDPITAAKGMFSQTGLLRKFMESKRMEKEREDAKIADPR